MGFLDPEAAIGARLLAKIAEAAPWTAMREPQVLYRADAEAVADASQMAPAFFVVFDGFAPTQQVGDGAVQTIEQDWSVWSVVRSAAGAGSAAGVREEAAIMLDLAARALLGFRPSADFSQLRLAQSEGPTFEAGYGQFPMRFKTRITVKGER